MANSFAHDKAQTDVYGLYRLENDNLFTVAEVVEAFLGAMNIHDRQRAFDTVFV